MLFIRSNRILALMLTVVMLAAVFVGCQSTPAQTHGEQTDPKPTQDPEEAAVLKILTIGNSHSVDANQMLYEVFRSEMPKQELVIAHLYKSGCRMEEHASFYKNNERAYHYYENRDGNWRISYQHTLDDGLKRDYWDVVVMQEMNTMAGVEVKYTTNDLETIIQAVKDVQPVEPTFYWHFLWANPVDYEWAFAPGMPIPGDTDAAIVNWKNIYHNYYGTNAITMYQKMANCTKKYIQTNENFKGIIPSGTAMQYMNDLLGYKDSDLYHDYTHLNDFTRVMVAYVWYATFMGIDSLDEIKLTEIPAHLRRDPSQGDMVLTQQQCKDMLEAINYALAHPMELPTL